MRHRSKTNVQHSYDSGMNHTDVFPHQDSNPDHSDQRMLSGRVNTYAIVDMLYDECNKALSCNTTNTFPQSRISTTAQRGLPGSPRVEWVMIPRVSHTCRVGVARDGFLNVGAIPGPHNSSLQNPYRQCCTSHNPPPSVAADFQVSGTTSISESIAMRMLHTAHILPALSECC